MVHTCKANISIGSNKWTLHLPQYMGAVEEVVSHPSPVAVGYLVMPAEHSGFEWYDFYFFFLVLDRA